MTDEMHDLGCEIADAGRWEEFHQKRDEFTMYDYWKARRFALLKIYRDRKAKGSSQ